MIQKKFVRLLQFVDPLSKETCLFTGGEIVKTPSIYIMSNKKEGVLYIGVTNSLNDRVREHKTGIGSEFTKRYRLTRLVYYEEYTSIKEAIYREKQLKKWNREWKINLIESVNPDWNDLFFEL